MGNKYFKNRVIWITGASTGIGRTCALDFAKRGAMVALSARSEDKLESLAKEIGPKQSIAIPVDVTDLQANRNAVAAIEEKWGRLDVAFLNAGTWEAMDLKDFNADIFDKHINVNYMGMVNGIDAALPALYRSKRPHLVGMSSSVAYRGLPRGEAYCASKAAQRAMLQGLRIQLLEKKVPVTIICPGFVKSPLTDQNDFDMPMLMEPEDAVKAIAKGMMRYSEEVDFPKTFTTILKLMALLPSPVYTKIMARMMKKS